MKEQNQIKHVDRWTSLHLLFKASMTPQIGMFHIKI